MVKMLTCIVITMLYHVNTRSTFHLTNNTDNDNDANMAIINTLYIWSHHSYHISIEIHRKKCDMGEKNLMHAVNK